MWSGIRIGCLRIGSCHHGPLGNRISRRVVLPEVPDDVDVARVGRHVDQPTDREEDDLRLPPMPPRDAVHAFVEADARRYIWSLVSMGLKLFLIGSTEPTCSGGMTTPMSSAR